MIRLFRNICLILAASGPVLQAAVLTGTVLDRISEKNLPDALIVLEDPLNEDFSMEVLSDSSGHFILRDIPPGSYKIAALKENYYSNSLFDLALNAEDRFDVVIRLLHQEGRWNAEYCFMIGGIEVKALERDVIPTDIVTTRRIESGEIEHMQADNLGDVLTLLPGVEKSRQVGLADEQRIGIRQIRSGTNILYGNETFGTTIVVDGNELNNDAAVTALGSSLNSGIDLRTIPADNIESVEVITGIPSVEYGNFSDGVVKVKTKTGLRRSRIKAKFNPDTRGLNYSSGMQTPSDGSLDYRFNYAFSERDPRKDGDEYHRFHFSGAYSAKTLENALEYTLNASHTRSLDDELPTDAFQRATYDRGYHSSSSLNWRLKRPGAALWDGSLNLDFERVDKFESRFVADQIDTVYGYISELREDGREWEANLRVKRVREKSLSGKRSFKTLMGLDFNYQENTGSGLELDSVYNYYGAYSTRRSYRFDQYPGFAKAALYAEYSRTTLLLGRSLEWMAGLRYDAVNVKGFDPSFHSVLDAPQGEFLSPRLNLRLQLTEDLFLRLGAGRSIKAVSLSHIYRNDAYIKEFVDSIWVEVAYPQQNPDLRSYPSDKAELSLDWKIHEKLGLSFTAYLSRSDRQPQIQDYPVGYSENPDTLTASTYSLIENLGWAKASGLELALVTKRIHDLKFILNATYRYNRRGETGLSYERAPQDWELLWYPSSENWKEKLSIGQQTSYISQRLGVWLTVDLQYILMDRQQTIYNGPSIFTNLDGHDIELFQGMTYWYQAYEYDYAPHWVLNARISKSLSQNSELSLYVNNLLDDQQQWVNPYTNSIYMMNVPIYYGLELSTEW